MKTIKKITAICLAFIMVVGFTNVAYASRRGAHHSRGVHHNNIIHHNRTIHHNNMFAPSNTARFYTEQGFPVNWSGGAVRHHSGGWGFGRDCWFIDASGNPVSAWGSQMFDAFGNPVF